MLQLFTLHVLISFMIISFNFLSFWFDSLKLFFKWFLKISLSWHSNSSIHLLDFLWVLYKLSLSFILVNSGIFIDVLFLFSEDLLKKNKLTKRSLRTMPISSYISPIMSVLVLKILRRILLLSLLQKLVIHRWSLYFELFVFTLWFLMLPSKHLVIWFSKEIFL